MRNDVEMHFGGAPVIAVPRALAEQIAARAVTACEEGRTEVVSFHEHIGSRRTVTVGHGIPMVCIGLLVPGCYVDADLGH